MKVLLVLEVAPKADTENYVLFSRGEFWAPARGSSLRGTGRQHS